MVPRMVPQMVLRVIPKVVPRPTEIGSSEWWCFDMVLNSTYVRRKKKTRGTT